MARKKSSIGCLFWIALILLVLVIFLLNRNTIETVLDKTGLVTYLTPNRDNTIPEEQEIPEDDSDTDAPIIVSRSVESESPPSTEAEKPEHSDQIVVVESNTEVQSSDERQPPDDSEAPPEMAAPEQRTRRSTIFYVQIDDEGTISLAPVIRQVRFFDSPLTDTIKTLLKGLTSTEINKGLLSLLPAGTELINVAIRGNTAHIDFNEPFRFNTFGKEGYKYQLKQIVFTATEFQTVQQVQILVEGEILPYLGPESPFVGQPLTREMVE